MSTEVLKSGTKLAISKPEPLNENHDFSQFVSGEPSIDGYTKTAYKNKSENNAAVFVICELNTNIVAGYYTLSAGCIFNIDAPRELKRNAPKEIPITTLGRLGVSMKWQGKGLGSNLVRDAIYRSRLAQEQVGIKALVVHAISQDVEDFYKDIGFKKIAKLENTLYLSLNP